MTRDLDTPLEIALGVVKPARARYMNVIDSCHGRVMRNQQNLYS